jgi:hypothetical protein
MANEKIFTDVTGDTLRVSVNEDYVWMIANAADTDKDFYLQFERDTAREMVDWLATRLDNKKILS